MPQPTSAESDDNRACFGFPAIAGKKFSGERCFLPIHVYDTATGRPVAMLLRTGKDPSGAEVKGHVRHRGAK